MTMSLRMQTCNSKTMGSYRSKSHSLWVEFTSLDDEQKEAETTRVISLDGLANQSQSEPGFRTRRGGEYLHDILLGKHWLVDLHANDLKGYSKCCFHFEN